MTKPKKPTVKSVNSIENENPDPNTKGTKKNYMVDDEDEDESLDLDDKELDPEHDLLDSDPDDKDIITPKTFDPFEEDEEEDEEEDF